MRQTVKYNPAGLVKQLFLAWWTMDKRYDGSFCFHGFLFWVQFVNGISTRLLEHAEQKKFTNERNNNFLALILSKSRTQQITHANNSLLYM
jgi:hypothetical protein